MQPETPPTPKPANPMWMTVLGWIFTLLAAAGLVASAFMKLAPPEKMAADIAANTERIELAQIGIDAWFGHRRGRLVR